MVYTVELTLFCRLLVLGAVRLPLFIVTRVAERPAEPVTALHGTRLGNVSNMLLPCSSHHAECSAIDKEPEHHVMEQHRFGTAESRSHESLQPRSEGEIVPFKLLRLHVAHRLMVRITRTSIHVGTSGIDRTPTQRGSPRFEWSADLALRGPQHLRSDDARSLIHGRPEPSRWRVLPDNTTHGLDFHCFHWVDLPAERIWSHGWDR
jgi:hypothetical protein